MNDCNDAPVLTNKELIDKLNSITTQDELTPFLVEFSTALDKMSYADVLRFRGEILSDCEVLTFLGVILDIFEGEQRLRAVANSRPRLLGHKK